LIAQDGAHAVIAAVAAAVGDLGLVRAQAPEQGAWWLDLVPPGAPKIIARLPFVERAGHAADLPLYVVAKPLADAAADDVAIYAIEGGEARPRDERIEILAQAVEGQRIVAVPGTWSAGAVAEALGLPSSAVTWVGSHARRFEIEDKRLVGA